jgi:hypothetical protein
LGDSTVVTFCCTRVSHKEKKMKNLIAVVALFVVGAFSSALYAVPVDEGNGREWRQIPETASVSWASIAAVCPQDGVTPCSGAVGNVDYTGWVWGTSAQVRTLLSKYSAALLTVDIVQNTGAGSSFVGAFGATVVENSGANTCTYCFPAEGGSTMGWTASKNAAGLPIAAAGGWSIQFLVGFFDSLSISAPTGATIPSGAMLWRPTGAGTLLVIANDDAGTTPTAAGGSVVANVLANDKNGGAQATLANVTLALVSSSKPGLTLNSATGAVSADTSVGAGQHTLTYRICSTTSSACDEAVVTATVPATVLRANNDSGALSGAVGGVAIANVLSNDTYGGAGATTANVTLSLVSSTSASVSLNTATGAVSAAQGTANGTYALVYRICDQAVASNCAQATATVTVRPNSIDAVADYARGSSKTGGTPIPNVLANDTLNGARATTQTVTITVLTAPPKGVTFDAATGAITVAPKTSSGTFLMDYRICEIASPTNCDTATVTLELSGKSGS